MAGVEVRRRRLQDAKSIRIKRGHSAMSAWAMSAREGFGRRASCRCLLPLLLVAIAARGARCMMVHSRAADDVPERRGNVLLSSTGKRFVYCTPGVSFVNPKRSDSFRPTECSGQISYHSCMTKLGIFKQIA